MTAVELVAAVLGAALANCPVIGLVAAGMVLAGGVAGVVFGRDD